MTITPITTISTVDHSVYAELAFLWRQHIVLSSGSHIAEDVLVELVSLYQGDRRFYHNGCHLLAMFNDLKKVEDCPPSVLWAVWFHDAIYSPGRKDNEALSAELAARSLVKMGLSEQLCQQVVYMIRCSQTHENPQACADTQLFLDADMAILASPPAVYSRYIQAIRQEYHHIPKFLFRRGRRAFLKELKAREAIYGSNAFFCWYEQAARANIDSELVADKSIYAITKA